MPRRVGSTGMRSEEHTSELQSRLHLVCRLLLEKKKKKGKQAARLREQRELSSVSMTSLCHDLLRALLHSTVCPSPVHLYPSLVVFVYKRRRAPQNPPSSPPRPFPV